MRCRGRSRRVPFRQVLGLDACSLQHNPTAILTAFLILFATNFQTLTALVDGEHDVLDGAGPRVPDIFSK